MKKLLSQAVNMIQQKQATIEEVTKRREEAEKHLTELQEKLNSNESIKDFATFNDLTREVAMAESYCSQLKRLERVVGQATQAETESAGKMNLALNTAIKSITEETREKLRKDAVKMLAIIEEADRQQDELHQMQCNINLVFKINYGNGVSYDSVKYSRDLINIRNGLKELLNK